MSFPPSPHYGIFTKAARFRGLVVYGMLVKEYIESERMQGYKPVFRTADNFPDLAQGEAITVDTISYEVAEYHRDGAGEVKMILEAQ